MSENENALRLYHMAEHKLKPYSKDGKLPITAWRKERNRLDQEYKTEQAELSPIHAEVKKLWQVKYKAEQVIHEQERQNAVNPRHQMEGVTPGYEGEINQQGKWKQKKHLLPTDANPGSRQSRKLQKPYRPLSGGLCPPTDITGIRTPPRSKTQCGAFVGRL